MIYSQGLCPQSFCEQANVYLQVRSCKRHPTGWDHRSKLGECYSSVLSDPRFPGGKASLLVFGLKGDFLKNANKAVKELRG